MRRRALPSALAVGFALVACFEAAMAQPSVTPGISVVANAGGNVNVDSGNGAVLLVCTVTNPKYNAMTNPSAPPPSGTVYFVGVSHSLSCSGCQSAEVVFTLALHRSVHMSRCALDRDLSWIDL